MRLSKPRLLLRAGLLLFLAGFMAWRALETGRTAAEPGLEPAGALMLSRIALVEWVLAALAVLTAAGVLLALRRKPRAHSLHLDGPPRADGASDPGQAGGEGRGAPPGA